MSPFPESLTFSLPSTGLKPREWRADAGHAGGQGSAWLQLLVWKALSNARLVASENKGSHWTSAQWASPCHGEQGKRKGAELFLEYYLGSPRLLGWAWNVLFCLKPLFFFFNYITLSQNRSVRQWKISDHKLISTGTNGQPSRNQPCEAATVLFPYYF